MATSTANYYSSELSIFTKSDDANANAGTIVVTHAPDTLNLRQCKLVDNTTGEEVQSAEYEVFHTTSTTTTFTNNCGAAAATTPATATVQNGSATTFTVAGAYSGKADGLITVVATKTGNLGITTVDAAVLAGTGSATVASSGTYTGSTNGNIVLTMLSTGETGTVTASVVFPDGTTIASWTTGATTVATLIGQGVSVAITSGAGNDLVAGDTITIPVHGKAQIQATFPDGTVSAVLDTATSTNATTLGQGVTLAMTAGAGDDVVVGDTWTIAVQAGTKNLKAIVYCPQV